RVLIGRTVNLNAKSMTENNSRSKPKGKANNNVEPEVNKEEPFVCRDSDVYPVYFNGEQVRSYEGDPAFRLKEEANRRISWEKTTFKDSSMWLVLRALIYDGKSVSELTYTPRLYGMLVFAISL